VCGDPKKPQERCSAPANEKPGVHTDKRVLLNKPESI
jgi:hypothetical protein